MTFAELLDEALKLSEEDRSTLADLLFASLDDIDEAECLQLWGAEAHLRLQEFERGLSSDIPEEEVMRDVRESFSQSQSSKQSD